MSKATLSLYLSLCLRIRSVYCFPLQQWLHERPQCYVTRSLPVLLYVALIVDYIIGS